MRPENDVEGSGEVRDLVVPGHGDAKGQAELLGDRVRDLPQLFEAFEDQAGQKLHHGHHNDNAVEEDPVLPEQVIRLHGQRRQQGYCTFLLSLYVMIVSVCSYFCRCVPHQFGHCRKPFSSILPRTERLL